MRDPIYEETILSVTREMQTKPTLRHHIIAIQLANIKQPRTSVCQDVAPWAL
jgi:hypothetical protein